LSDTFFNEFSQGDRTMVFFFGCSIGAALSPIIGGFLFQHISSMALWHYNLANEIIKVFHFPSKWSISIPIVSV